MGRTTNTNRMKATIWTPTMRSEVDGTPDGVIPMAFYALSTPERRAKCIAELQRIDAKLTARAQEPSEDAAP
jgi:hypothetical protein